MDIKDMTYTQAIAELEKIAGEMQSENCDIDTLAARTSRALELLKFCKEKLTKTDEQVKKFLEDISRLS